MSKKAKVKNYLRKNVDFTGFKAEVQNSWLASRPISELKYNGVTNKYFYEKSKEAVKLAGYKYPESDRTCLTVNDVIAELITETFWGGAKK